MMTKKARTETSCSSCESDRSSACVITEDAMKPIVATPVQAFSSSLEESLSQALSESQERDMHAELCALVHHKHAELRATIENICHEICFAINGMKRTGDHVILCGMRSIPVDLIHLIMSICNYKDILRIAMISKHFHDCVENFSSRELERMRQVHHPDESWDQRIIMHASRRLERLPPRLPHRYLLKCARETHLYSLEGGSPGSAYFAMHPKGRMLICNATPSPKVRIGVDVWDLEQRRRVQTITMPTDTRIYDTVWFMGKHIVAAEVRGPVVSNIARFHVWSVDGTLLHSIETPDTAILSSTTCVDKLFIISPEDDGLDRRQFVVSIIDVPAGEFMRNVRPIGNPQLGRNRHFHTYIASVGDWLVVQFDHQEGLHVFNRSDLSQVSVFPGKFSSVKGSDDGSFFVANDMTTQSVTVMSVKNGRIVPLHSLSQKCWYDELLISSHKSKKLYVLSSQVEKEWQCRAVDVVDVTSGELLQSLSLPRDDAYTGAKFFTRGNVTNGREVFCGYSIDRPGHQRKFYIKAYQA